MVTKKAPTLVGDIRGFKLSTLVKPVKVRFHETFRVDYTLLIKQSSKRPHPIPHQTIIQMEVYLLLQYVLPLINCSNEKC